jgi:hypothetical protein
MIAYERLDCLSYPLPEGEGIGGGGLNGYFALRIEDTDVGRSTPESVNATLEGITCLGLEYDRGSQAYEP